MKLLVPTIAAFIVQSAIFLPSSLGYGGGYGGEGPPQVAPFSNQHDICTDFCKGVLTTCEGVVDWVTNTYAVELTRHVDGGAGTGPIGKPSEQFDACHGTCMGWVYFRQEPLVTGETRFFQGYAIGDTLNCRYNHLQFASGLPSTPYGLHASESESAAEHCAHITPDGGWVCTDYRNEDGKTATQLYKEAYLKHRMGDCFLSADDKIADCHRKGISDATVDQNLLWLPDDIEYIFLQANTLTKVPDLSRFTKLKAIYMANNILESLSSDDFAGNPNLEVLDIGNNFITELPVDVLTPLPKLKALFASVNYIETIPAGLFSNNKEIEMIAFVSNKLERFLPGTFDGLSSLELLAFGQQGKGAFEGNILSEDAFPEGLFDDLVSLQYFSSFIHDVGVLKASVFGEWSANLESIAMFIYGLKPDQQMVVEPGVWEKVPKLKTFSTYTGGAPIDPSEVANNVHLKSFLYGNQFAINAPLPFSGRLPKPELIPPSSTPISAAPSDAPTTGCVDNEGTFKVRLQKGKKKELKKCSWSNKSRCEKYPVVAENCPKSCDLCG